MRAAIFEHLGPARDVLRVIDLADVPPGSGEVQVEVQASGVNPTDVKLRGGAPGRKLAFPLIVPHHDGAGVITHVGAGVDVRRIGQRVWVYGAQNGRAFGTSAQYVTLPARLAVPLSDTLSFDEGACLGVPAMTAWEAVMGDGPPKGDIVLVTGGAGNVGRYAVQLARLAGARVIATVSSEAKAIVACEAGAEATVDYTAPDAAAQILDMTKRLGVTRVVDVDTTRNAALIANVIAPGARVISYGSGALDAAIPVRDFRQKNATIRFLNILRLPPDHLDRNAFALNSALASGGITHGIDSRFPLAEIAAAHEKIESGTAIGRVLVHPS